MTENEKDCCHSQDDLKRFIRDATYVSDHIEEVDDIEVAKNTILKMADIITKLAYNNKALQEELDGLEKSLQKVPTLFLEPPWQDF